MKGLRSNQTIPSRGWRLIAKAPTLRGPVQREHSTIDKALYTVLYFCLLGYTANLIWSGDVSQKSTWRVWTVELFDAESES